MFGLAASALLIADAAEPTIVIRRPTVIAFFAPVSNHEMETDTDENEALADFQLYASQVRKPLQEAGIDFHELYVRSFRVRSGKKFVTFRPQQVEVGYYFVEPGKKPRVEYGVMTHTDILQIAKQQFGLTPK